MSDLNLKGALTYYSNKLKTYITQKITKVENDISTLDSKVNTDKIELEDKIQINSNIITKNSADIIKNTNDITSNTNDITDVQVQMSEVIASATHLEGDTVYINDVEQYSFRNITIGETVEIPNINFSNDFMIECFTEINTGTALNHTVITLDENNKDKFIYNPKYIDVSADGIKPKDTVLIAFNKTQATSSSGIVYDVYESDIIAADIVDTIESIISIKEESI